MSLSADVSGPRDGVAADPVSGVVDVSGYESLRIGAGILLTSRSRPTDTYPMANLIERRWRRYGHDRVYLTTPDGSAVGHVDLVAQTVVATAPAYEAALRECLARWSGDSDSATVTPTASVDPVDPTDVRDLANNVAGAAVRAKRNEVNAKAPVLNLVARVFGVKTEERAWRVGADGEEKVAAELAKLGPAWRVLHSVEVGTNDSDIDHVLIGPPGVFTVNTKRHPGGRAWVGEHKVLVNGQGTDYLPKSRFEGRRAAKLLSAACGRFIEVQPVIVFVDLDDFKVKQMPADVHVTYRLRLRQHLQSLTPVMDEPAIEAIFAVARRSTTWAQAPAPSSSARERL